MVHAAIFLAASLAAAPAATAGLPGRIQSGGVECAGDMPRPGLVRFPADRDRTLSVHAASDACGSCAGEGGKTSGCRVDLSLHYPERTALERQAERSPGGTAGRDLDWDPFKFAPGLLPRRWHDASRPRLRDTWLRAGRRPPRLAACGRPRRRRGPGRSRHRGRRGAPPAPGSAAPLRAAPRSSNSSGPSPRALQRRFRAAAPDRR